jgi:hypothetical protein
MSGCICDGSKLFPRCDRNGQNNCPRTEERDGEK